MIFEIFQRFEPTFSSYICQKVSRFGQLGSRMLETCFCQNYLDSYGALLRQTQLCTLAWLLNRKAMTVMMVKCEISGKI
jgi:hypothetical protein